MLQIKNTLGGGKSNAPYAWAKYEYKSITPIVELTQVAVDNYYYYLNMSCDSKDVSTITKADIVGLQTTRVASGYADTYWTFGESKVVRTIKGSTNTDSFSYQVSDGQIIISLGGTGGNTIGEWSSISLATIESYNFIEYVIDKSPTKYPNGEVNTDGYFYRYASEGLYVWKKYKYNPPVTVSNPSITITCPSTFGNKLNITSADIDIKTLWEDLWSTSSNKDLSRILTDAYGNISEWKSSSGISIGLASSMTSKIGFVSKNGTDGISYLYKDTSIPTYCVFVMGASSNFSVYAGTYTFNGEYKISDSSVEFIDYVVSDKETAYPDGGEKGGYWYEKVFDISAFGFTEYAIDTYIPTYDQKYTTIAGSTKGHKFSHSLGKEPQFAIVWCPSLMISNYYNTDKYYLASAEIGVINPSSDDTGSKCFSIFSCTAQSSKTCKASYSTTALGYCLKSDYIWVQISNYFPYLKGGETYYIITIA